MCVIVQSSTIEGKQEKILNSLTKAIKPDTINVDSGLALLAVVGRGMVKAKGTAARIVSAVSAADVNIRMIDQGSSELNVIIGVDEKELETALKAIYSEFVK